MTKRITLLLFALLLALSAVRIPLPRASAADEPLLVIVGTTFPADDIPFSVLKEAFRGRPAVLRGKRLIPLNHPVNSPLRVAFDRAVLGLEPDAIGRFWIDTRVRDEGKPPVTPAGDSMFIARIVAALPLSVTYGGRAMLIPTVKAITVDGKSANQAGYPVRR